MKVGILTLHSQVNYGGVLQAFALQEVLKAMGHDVVVIDRWMDERNGMLKGITSSRSVVGWVKFLSRAALGFGDGADYIRHVRTSRMLPSLFRLTPYSFYHWKDAPANLDVDVLVVGSDQVWNPKLQGRELPYLLEGAPSVPAIAYAASFGTPHLHANVQERYRFGFKRFAAISVREEEGVRIVKSLGGNATHVLDPTLLADKSIWSRFCKTHVATKRRKLVCYLIHDPLGFVINYIKDFANVQNCSVQIFFGTPCTLLPSNLIELIKISTGPIRAYVAPNIYTRASAAYDAFVAEMASADWIISDSFHALMFATIFHKNIRILVPRRGRGVSSFARLKEFIEKNVVSPVLCDDFPSALQSLITDESTRYNTFELEMRRRESLSWLELALSSI